MPSLPSDPIENQSLRESRDLENVLTLAEERVVVGKRLEDAGGVKVRKRVEEVPTRVEEELRRETVSVERVPMNRPIDALPEVRTEGDVTIIPVVEEIVVVEKRYVLREEIRITRAEEIHSHAETVTLRREVADIERIGS